MEDVNILFYKAGSMTNYGKVFSEDTIYVELLGIKPKDFPHVQPLAAGFEGMRYYVTNNKMRTTAGDILNDHSIDMATKIFNKSRYEIREWSCNYLDTSSTGNFVMLLQEHRKKSYTQRTNSYSYGSRNSSYRRSSGRDSLFSKFLNTASRYVFDKPLKVYHFTDESNIPLIQKYGLLSWYQLLQRGIQNTPGSNELSRKLDYENNTHDYVNLCFTKNHPMARRCVYDGRIKNLVWLEIDPVVFNWRGTRYCNINSNTKGSYISRDKAFATKSWSDQAEILVSKYLSTKYITFPYSWV